MIKAKRDLVNSIILLAFCSLAYYGALVIPDRSYGKTGADFFPKIVIGIVAFLSICLLIQSIIRVTKEKESKMTVSPKLLFRENRKVIFTFVIFGIYILLLEYIGYFISSVLFMIALYYLLAVKKQKIWVVLLGTVALTYLLYLIFQKALSVFLPAGMLF